MCCVVPSADGCCVEFRLASSGQDSRVNVWILTQRDGSGRFTTERARGGETTVLAFKSLQWNNCPCVRNKSPADSLMMDHLMTFSRGLCARVCRIRCFMPTHRECCQTTGWISVVNTRCCDFLRSVAMAMGFFIFIKAIVVLCILFTLPLLMLGVCGGTFLWWIRVSTWLIFIFSCDYRILCFNEVLFFFSKVLEKKIVFHNAAATDAHPITSVHGKQLNLQQKQSGA